MVCTRTRLDETAIFLQRGPVKRREGSKRRQKTGKKRRGQLSVPGTLNQGQVGEEVKIKLEDLGQTIEEFLNVDLES